MTKEDVLKLFPEATPEQIASLLNLNDTDVAKANAGIDAYKDKAKKFDELEKAKMSADEKLKQALADAEKAKSDNLKMLNRTKAVAELNKAGLTEDDYKDIIDGFISDDEESTISKAKSFADLFSKKKKEYEAELKHKGIKDMPKPNGGKEGGKELDEGEQLAANIAKAQTEAFKAASDSRKFYLGGN